MPVINYLWVGEPTKTSASAIAGHDVAGPIETARSLKANKQNSDTKIQFWCLEEHIAFYKTQFAEAGVADTIHLCSIESALTDSNRPEAKIFQTLLPKAKSPDVKDRVAFKDGFSLYLLLTQGGFFFDTNIFPVDGKQMDLSSVLAKAEVMTARSPEARNDFYLMYSPKPYHPVAQEVLEKWLLTPVLGNLSAFEVSQTIPKLFPNEIEEMGFKKVSYKSYYSQDQGLFFWLDTQKIIPYLGYGDINGTSPLSGSIRPLCDFNLAEVMREDWGKIQIPENLYAIPFTTDKALVRKKFDVYFVDGSKIPPECILIHDDYGEHLTKSFSTQQVELVSKDLMPIHRFIANLIIKSKGKLPYIANVENCTLLHHAVFTKNLPLIEALISAGAKQDIKARYKWYLSEDNHEIRDLTPLELAQTLGDEEVLQAFSLANEAVQLRVKAQPLAIEQVVQPKLQSSKEPHQESEQSIQKNAADQQPKRDSQIAPVEVRKDFLSAALSGMVESMDLWLDWFNKGWRNTLMQEYDYLETYDELLKNIIVELDPIIEDSNNPNALYMKALCLSKSTQFDDPEVREEVVNLMLEASKQKQPYAKSWMAMQLFFESSKEKDVEKSKQYQDEALALGVEAAKLGCKNAMNMLISEKILPANEALNKLNEFTKKIQPKLDDYAKANPNNPPNLEKEFNEYLWKAKKHCIEIYIKNIDSILKGDTSWFAEACHQVAMDLGNFPYFQIEPQWTAFSQKSEEKAVTLYKKLALQGDEWAMTQLQEKNTLPANRVQLALNQLSIGSLWKEYTKKDEPGSRSSADKVVFSSQMEDFRLEALKICKKQYQAHIPQLLAGNDKPFVNAACKDIAKCAAKKFQHEDKILRIIADVFFIPLGFATAGLAFAAKYALSGSATFYATKDTKRQKISGKELKQLIKNLEPKSEQDSEDIEKSQKDSNMNKGFS